VDIKSFEELKRKKNTIRDLLLHMRAFRVESFENRREMKNLLRDQLLRTRKKRDAFFKLREYW